MRRSGLCWAGLHAIGGLAFFLAMVTVGVVVKISTWDQWEHGVAWCMLLVGWLRESADVTEELDRLERGEQ